MKTNRVTKWLFAGLGLSAVLLLAGGLRAETITYKFSVNTTSVAGSSGYLDFQFNPGNTPFDPASVTLTDFTSDGSLTGALGDIGDVTGTFPGTVVIDNTSPGGLNDHTEGFTFGSFFDVFATLDIPDVSGTAAAGSTFALSVFQSDGATPALTGDPLIEIDLDAITGSPSITNNSQNGEASIALVPEPGSSLLFAMGLAGLLARFRRNR